MDDEKLASDQLARKMAKIQKEITGLEDSVESVFVSNEPATSDWDSGEDTDSQNITSTLESAKKVMQLLARMRQCQDKSLGETIGDLDTHENAELDTRPTNSKQEIGPNQIPTKIGRFEVVSLLGQGGFGLVFLANDPKLDRMVALKVPTFGALLNQDAQQRFKRESRVVASLSHPNIVPIYEVGEEGPISFIASEYIPGCDLAKWVANHGPLEPRKAAESVATIADAIQHAHRRDIIHRDLKPANILIKSLAENEFDSANVLVTDFGLARWITKTENSATRTGSVIGTPAFAAPEQLSSSTEGLPTESADIYSLGAVLYFLLTGVAPFASNSIVDLIRLVETQPPRPPRNSSSSIPHDLDAICLKCLEKSPSNRYSSASELNADLERFLNGEVVKARPTSTLQRSYRWIKRNPFPTALLAVVAISALIVSALLWRSEGLRRVSQLKERQVIEKTKQLQQAVDKLFLTVAVTPELKLNDSQKFRSKLLAEASELVASFSQETPDDPEIFELYVRTQLSFLKLKSVLGNLPTSEIESLNSAIDRRLNTLEIGSDLRNRILISKIKLKLIHLKSVPDNDQIRMIQEEILDLVDGELALYQNLESDLARALALSIVAERSVYSRNYTVAKKYSVRAFEAWEKIPAEQLNKQSVLDQFVECCRASLVTIAGSEDAELGLRIGKRAVDLLGPHLQDQLSPEATFALADLYRIYGFLHVDADNEKAMKEAERLTNKGHEIALQLAKDHPRVLKYQAQVGVSNYSAALLPFIEKNYDQSESLLVENIELAKQLSEQFPGGKERVKHNLTNTLNLLGLIYNERGQWEKKLENLTEAKHLIVTDEDKSQVSFFKVQVASLDADIGECHVELGQHELGLKMLISSAEELEQLLAKDPGNGQAKRFLRGNCEQTFNALCKLDQYQKAKVYFDRRVELNGNKLSAGLVATKIKLLSGLGEDQNALKLLKDYHPKTDKDPSEFQKRDLSELKTQVRVLSDAVVEVDRRTAQGIPDGEALEMAMKLRRRLTEEACEVLKVVVSSSDDKSAEIDSLKNDDRLTTLTQSDAFLRIVVGD